MSLFHFVTILGLKSLPNAASHVGLWACSVQVKTNSCCAITVRSSCPTVLIDCLQYHVEFGLYVDRHGEPCRSSQTIEWEGTAEHVAWHPPYVLLFDSRFIEIRHVETGRLAQIISGNDMRCIWDGRGSNSVTPATPGAEGWHEGVSQEPRVHGVMNVPDTNRNSRNVTQHVFELIPTIPLYLPGSLSSPSQSTYFAQTNSPPHSPQLNPALTWNR